MPKLQLFHSPTCCTGPGTLKYLTDWEELLRPICLCFSSFDSFSCVPICAAKGTRDRNKTEGKGKKKRLSRRENVRTYLPSPLSVCVLFFAEFFILYQYSSVQLSISVSPAEGCFVDCSSVHISTDSNSDPGIPLAVLLYPLGPALHYRWLLSGSSLALS